MDARDMDAFDVELLFEGNISMEVRIDVCLWLTILLGKEKTWLTVYWETRNSNGSKISERFGTGLVDQK